MKSIFLAALFGLTASCRKPEPAMVDYVGPDGSFRCRVPAEWTRVEDRNGGPLAMFFERKSGGAANLSISRYPGRGDSIRTPRQYWDALRLTDRNPSPLEPSRVAGREVYRSHLNSPHYADHDWKVLSMDREDLALIPTASGLFAISHTAPVESYEKSLPVLDAVVKTFSPHE